MPGRDKQLAGKQSAPRSALSLALIALVGAAMLTGIYQLTRERIIAQEQKAVLTSLNQVIPAQHYDNAMETDFVFIHDPGEFLHPDPVKVYRARLGDEPVGVIMQIVAGDGFKGDIHFLLGIDPQGQIRGVRITQHRETPGLGDVMELEKSDWVLGFDQRSLEQPPRPKWDVKRYGGYFDQFTGATITPRSIVRAVARALEYYQTNSDALFAAPTEYRMDM